MAHGAPDDSDTTNKVTVYRVDDMAELAARLGSIVSFIRSGKVLFMEGFETGLGAWAIATPGDDAEISLSDDNSFVGGVCAYLDSGTGETPYSQMTKYFPAPEASKVGLAAYFSIGGVEYWYAVELIFGDGTHGYHFRVKYLHSDGKLYYWTESDTETEFGEPGKLNDTDNNMYSLKLVIDLEHVEYSRFYLNSIEYSMADLVPDVVGVTNYKYLQVIITCYGDGTYSNLLYLDNVVLTFDEF